ncbi:MAG: DUF4190 domain-containing protein [Lachnospiraceae bacterium]|nr:DUF4190 domain-containing protein [Lachnospiraceae bacterium]
MDNNRSDDFNFGNPYGDAYGDNPGMGTADSNSQKGLYGQPAPAQSNPGQNQYGQNDQDFYRAQNSRGSFYGQPAEKPPAPAKGLAITSLVCGIIGLLTVCLFGIGGLFGLIAVILAIIAGVKGNKSGLKIAGLISGILAVIFSVVTIIFFCAALSEMDEALKGADIGGINGLMEYFGDTTDIMNAFRRAAKDPDVKDDPGYEDALDELRDGIILNGYDPEDNCIVEKAYEIMGEDEVEDFLEMTEKADGCIYIQMDSANSVEISLK